MRRDHGGRNRHIALAVTQLAPLKARLDAAGVAFSRANKAARRCFAEIWMATLEFIEDLRLVDK